MSFASRLRSLSTTLAAGTMGKTGRLSLSSAARQGGQVARWQDGKMAGRGVVECLVLEWLCGTAGQSFELQACRALFHGGPAQPTQALNCNPPDRMRQARCTAAAVAGGGGSSSRRRSQRRAGSGEAGGSK
jgi:hypothetical protein